MGKNITGKGVPRKWIVPVLAVFLLMAVLIMCLIGSNPYASDKLSLFHVKRQL